jgi:hypothetical protein
LLADYTAAFDPRIIGLTGAPDKITAAANAYEVSYADRQVGDDYFLDHSATIYVTRPDGTPAPSLLASTDSAVMVKSLRPCCNDPPGEVDPHDCTRAAHHRCGAFRNNGSRMAKQLLARRG